MSQYDELVWVVLWVERAAKLAAALDMQVCPGEGGISGAVASAIKKDADGEPYLTVTKELLREARQWRLRQRAAEVAASTGLYAADLEGAQEGGAEAGEGGDDPANPILALFEKARARRGEVV